MKTIYQHNIATSLLLSLFLQSCGVGIWMGPSRIESVQATAGQMQPSDVAAKDTSLGVLGMPSPLGGNPESVQQLARQFLSGEQDSVKDFLKCYMYTTPRYNRTLALMVREIARQQVLHLQNPSVDIRPIVNLFKLMDSGPLREILGFQHLLLQLRLLNEWLMATEGVQGQAKAFVSVDQQLHLTASLRMWFTSVRTI
ncbi:MAG: hypothetical protein AAFV97_02065 [Bacteroidota bacterium]